MAWVRSWWKDMINTIREFGETMAFRLGDLLIVVIHPDLSEEGAAPVPIPPRAAHPPNWIDDMRAALALASATLEARERMLAPPRTLVEATALEQHLIRALRLVREAKEELAAAAPPPDADEADSDGKATGNEDVAP
jgi:hypothetical protein